MSMLFLHGDTSETRSSPKGVKLTGEKRRSDDHFGEGEVCEEDVMRYRVKIEGVVEAEDAAAAKAVCETLGEEIQYSKIQVTPDIRWAVTASVPVVYKIDFIFDAESEED